MKEAKRSSLCAKRKTKRKKIRRHLRSIVAYFKCDGYLFAPLFSNSRPLSPQMQMPPPSDDVSVAGFEELGMEKENKKKRRMSEKVKEYLKSDCYMYGPMISSSKLGSSHKGKLQINNLVTMDVSTSTTTTIRKDIRPEIADEISHKGRIDSPKRRVVILEGQRNGLKL